MPVEPRGRAEERSVEAVDELCRLALAATRLGCRVRLLDLDADLCALLSMAGVDGLFLGDEEHVGDLP